MPASGRSGRESIHADRAGCGGHPPVGRHCQHIAQPVVADRARAAWGRRRRPRRRPPTPRAPSPSTARAINAAASAGLVAKPLLVLGIPASSQRSASSAQELGRYRARSIRACPRRCGIGQVDRDLGVLDPPGGAGVLPLHPDGGCPSSHPRSRRPPGLHPGHRRRRRRSHADRHGPRRRPISPVTADAATRRGSHRRGARRSSSSSCGPAPRPSRASTQPHAATARTGQTAARSDRSPPRTQSTTDQGLRYEPRRPRPNSGCLHKPRTLPRSPPLPVQTRQNHHRSRTTAAVLGAPDASRRSESRVPRP